MYGAGDVVGGVLILQIDRDHFDIFLYFVSVRCSRLPDLPANRNKPYHYFGSDIAIYQIKFA